MLFCVSRMFLGKVIMSIYENSDSCQLSLELLKGFMYLTGPCGQIKDKGDCQMEFNSSDCVWDDSRSVCLGPERCVQPQIKGKKKYFINRVDKVIWPP